MRNPTHPWWGWRLDGDEGGDVVMKEEMVERRWRWCRGDGVEGGGSGDEVMTAVRVAVAWRWGCEGGVDDGRSAAGGGVVVFGGDEGGLGVVVAAAGCWPDKGRRWKLAEKREMR
ncbi:hypothetical protein Tco_0624819 [Tanacetum coccineum]|uniref:Uncharacterized protein n=1 Tax=Tanacetum coccineum TaxID=301880 RepID=A0ABQ4WF12_9ASTR